MPKKSRSNLESQLEWYYVSTQTLVRILIGILVLAGAIAGGIFFFLKRDETAVRAKQAIAEADDALHRGREHKEQRERRRHRGRRQDPAGEPQHVGESQTKHGRRRGRLHQDRPERHGRGALERRDDVPRSEERRV